MTAAPHQTDVVIIGAGPSGLFAVFQLGMLNIRCHVVDSLEEIGGQCQALYPEKPIYDIPAHPHILAGDLVAQLEAQAQPFRPQYHLNQQVVQVEEMGLEGYRITTSTGTVIDCKAIIIAAGAGAFGPNRPPLEGIETYEGRSVFYMVKRIKDFTGKRIVIAGGGDSAVDWAISLAALAEKIYFVHRRDKFRAAPESVEKLNALAEGGKVEMVIPYQLAALEGENNTLHTVVVKDMEEQERRLQADILLPFFGLVPKLEAMEDWGLEIKQHQIAVDPATMQTCRKGIFAIGDIAQYNHKLKLIVTGFAEAATAAHAIHPLIFPGQALHFVYSTTKGIA